MGEAVAYWLVFVDLAVGVAVAWIVIWCLLWAMQRVRRAKSAATEGLTTVKRRCETCGSSWWSLPGQEVSGVGLQLRRSVRKFRRRHRSRSWAWTARKGWSRCPSCLSRNVRDSAGQDVGFTKRERRELRVSQGR